MIDGRAKSWGVNGQAKQLQNLAFGVVHCALHTRHPCHAKIGEVILAIAS